MLRAAPVTSRRARAPSLKPLRSAGGDAGGHAARRPRKMAILRGVRWWASSRCSGKPKRAVTWRCTQRGSSARARRAHGLSLNPHSLPREATLEATRRGDPAKWPFCGVGAAGRHRVAPASRTGRVMLRGAPITSLRARALSLKPLRSARGDAGGHVERRPRQMAILRGGHFGRHRVAPASRTGRLHGGARSAARLLRRVRPN